MSYFSRSLIKYLYEEIKNKIKDRKDLFTEIDLQYLFINLIKEFSIIMENNSFANYRIDLLNCLYLGSKENTYIYPDLIIFRNCSKLELIVEFKFFRENRKFDEKEILRDFAKIKFLIDQLNKKHKKYKSTIGLEIIFDSTSHPKSKRIKKICQMKAFSLVTKNMEKNTFYTLYFHRKFNENYELSENINKIRKILEEQAENVKKIIQK